MSNNIHFKDAGFIIRTAAQDCDEKSLIEEIQGTYRFWKSIERSMIKRRAPALLYSDNDFISRILRDELTGDVEEIVIDSQKLSNQAMRMIKNMSPTAEINVNVRRYIDDTPIFEKFHVAEEIAKLSSREVELPSGGFIVIDKTEALTAIDVNTGHFVGDLNLSDTVFKVNIEAAEMIMRQICLRDIGGIIIVDFIDMPRDDYKEELMKFLRNEADKDKVRTKVIDMTPLGLVEITRKRSR